MRMPWPSRQDDFCGGGGEQTPQALSSTDNPEGQAAQESAEVLHQEEHQPMSSVKSKARAWATPAASSGARTSLRPVRWGGGCQTRRGCGAHLLRRRLRARCALVQCPVLARSGHGAHHPGHRHPSHLMPELPSRDGCNHIVNWRSDTRAMATTNVHNTAVHDQKQR